LKSIPCKLISYFNFSITRANLFFSMFSFCFSSLSFSISKIIFSFSMFEISCHALLLLLLFLKHSLGRYLCWWTISPLGYHPPNSQWQGLIDICVIEIYSF
jgi:hypothetical protein